MRISFKGSSDEAKALKLNDRVVFVIEGVVDDIGTKATKTTGDLDYGKISIGSVVKLTGGERTQMLERLAAARDAAEGKTALPLDSGG